MYMLTSEDTSCVVVDSGCTPVCGTLFMRIQQVISTVHVKFVKSFRRPNLDQL